jgi:hypothetical protein
MLDENAQKWGEFMKYFVKDLIVLVKQGGREMELWTDFLVICVLYRLLCTFDPGLFCLRCFTWNPPSLAETGEQNWLEKLGAHSSL